MIVPDGERWWVLASNSPPRAVWGWGLARGWIAFWTIHINLAPFWVCFAA